MKRLRLCGYGPLLHAFTFAAFQSDYRSRDVSPAKQRLWVVLEFLLLVLIHDTAKLFSLMILLDSGLPPNFSRQRSLGRDRLVIENSGGGINIVF